MDSGLRNTPGLISRIERLRDDLIRRFENLVAFAAIDKTDRNTTAAVQYHMQIETAALIRATEELQTLVRNLQEMWLFGQLKPIGESEIAKQTDENAKTVASLLKQLAERQSITTEVAEGSSQKTTD